jgi:hypothetical protein
MKGPLVVHADAKGEHMATKAWDADLSGVSHYVEIDHGTMIGK